MQTILPENWPPTECQMTFPVFLPITISTTHPDWPPEWAIKLIFDPRTLRVNHTIYVSVRKPGLLLSWEWWEKTTDTQRKTNYKLGIKGGCHSSHSKLGIKWVVNVCWKEADYQPLEIYTCINIIFNEYSKVNFS